jgi:ATP-dependent helicase HrpB
MAGQRARGPGGRAKTLGRTHGVAKERDERLGERVGYSVRFEDVSGPKTRLRYVTEGVLLRRLLEDPELEGVGAVVLDEFHERHIATDLLLVLLDRLTSGARPDLKLVVMSATLEAAPVAKYLADCVSIRSLGQLFPLSVVHLPKPDDRPLEKQIASAVREATSDAAGGDVLVFVPGALEIRKATETLAALAKDRDLLVLPLHGDLPIAEQVRAVEPAARRKVVLATNVAESSVTVDGVSAVIDSGLSRFAGHSPWTGLPTLRTGPISRASATQRAGRAGRTRPGRVFRLYTRADFETRREHDLPEIVRAELSEALLMLHASGVRDPQNTRWLDAPEPAQLSRAQELLELLGAVSEAGELTPVGRRMLEFPLPPRLARLVLAGELCGVGAEACLLAALLGERDLLSSARQNFGTERRGRDFGARGPSDLLERCALYQEAENMRFAPERVRALGLDPRIVSSVEKTSQRLRRGLQKGARRPADSDGVERALLRALLAAFPDRVARRRRSGERELVLTSGGTARLSESSVVVDAEFLLAIEVEDRSLPGAGLSGASAVVVRSASAIEPDWLLEDFPKRVLVRDELEWNAQSERVERTEKISFGSVVLEELRRPAEPSARAGELLLARARSGGALDLSKTPEFTALVARLRLLAKHFPEAHFPSFAGAITDALLLEASKDLVSFAELRALDLGQTLLAGLEPRQRALLETETPERLRLPGGRAVTIHYEDEKLPWVESRLQDFFGMQESPAICRGAVPLTLHLLAPNQRAVQVTSDLSGFWERHYPAIRRELMRRYPRHAWPEDGRSAKPPEPRR